MQLGDSPLHRQSKTADGAMPGHRDPDGTVIRLNHLIAVGRGLRLRVESGR